MYTVVQRPLCKKENMATCVHTGRVSNDYSRIRMARARVHGWDGTEKLCRRRVHGEPTGWVGMEWVIVFIAMLEKAVGVSEAVGLRLVPRWRLSALGAA